MEMRALKLLSVTAVVLLVAVIVLFVFGTPQAPEVAVPQAASASLEPGAAAPGSAGQALAVDPSAAEQPGGSGVDMSGMGAADPDAKAPEADPASPLAIEIPGCVCHSDDPKEVERHAEYRMNQCAGCHMGGAEGE
jgi:hypothetical protein